MNRRLVALDRFVVLLLGLALVALGLLAVDWRERLVLDGYADTLRTTPTTDVMGTAWWPWAFAAAGVLLGLVGLWWLLTHLRRPGPSTLRSGASDETGRVQVDLRSVASAAADHLATIAPVVDPRGTTRAVGGTTVLELRGRVDPAADVDALAEAAATCSSQIAAAFPDDRVEARLVLDAPQRSRLGRNRRVRVR